MRLIRRAVRVFIHSYKDNKKGKPESWESLKKKINFGVKIFIKFAKAGKLRLLFEMIITGMELKLTWEKAMDLANGKYFTKQVENAADKFKTDNPDKFSAKVNIPGYDKWEKSQ